MGERLHVECDDCSRRMRCADRGRHCWDAARYWAKGAEVLPCSRYAEDYRVAMGYVPRAPLVVAGKIQMIHGRPLW